MSDMTEYNKWVKRVQEVNFPHWDELPKFDLYMDQVVAFLTGYTGPLGLSPVTSTMINNYVKQRAIVAPTKKKYQVMQIADILLITLLKQGFPIDVIRAGIDRVTATEYPKQAYDRFIDLLNEKMKIIGEETTRHSSSDLTQELMEVTANMVIDHIQTNELIRIVQNSDKHTPTKIK
ncbi:DUF1836 domain-containing protein [Pediococcus argentinicus]|uniref:DUF1836 domain-containing protein n=1 Tax=Pediococcus argentinicus TaxID=480391 RepID=UPI00338D85A5